MESLKEYNKENEIKRLEREIEEITVRDRYGYRVIEDIKPELSGEELAAMEKQFGTAIESVTELTKAEGELVKKSGGHYRKAGQSVMQFFGEFHPKVFAELERECMAAFPCLRWVYFDHPPFPARKILLEKRSLDLKIYDMERAGKSGLLEAVKAGIEAERRKGFLLTKEAPIRIRVYRNSKYSYAVLLCWAEQEEIKKELPGILKILFPGWTLPDAEPARELQEPGEGGLKNQYAVAYWKNLLKDYAAGTKVPGYFEGTVIYEKASALFSIDPETVELSEQACGRCGLKFRGFLETIWGLLLMKLTGQYYSLFGVNCGRGILKIQPVLVTAEQRDSFFAIGRRVQKQVKEGERFTGCTIEQIEKSLGWREPLLTHVLEFHTFDGLEQFVGRKAGSGGRLFILEDVFSTEASEPEKSRISGSYGLAVCFCRKGKSLAMNIVYDRTHYAYENIKVLQKLYFYLLREASLNMEKPVGDIKLPEIAFYQDTEQDRKLRRLKAVLFLKKAALFQDVPIRDIFSVVEQGEYRAFVANDSIYSEGGYIEKVDFIVEGEVEVSKMNSEKVVKSIMVKKAGEPVTLDGLLPSRRCACNYTVVSGEVLLFSLEGSYILSLAERYPGLFGGILEAEKRYCASLERLWVNRHD